MKISSKSGRIELLRLLGVKILTTFYRRLYYMARPLDDPIPDLHPGLPVSFEVRTAEEMRTDLRVPQEYKELIRIPLAGNEHYFIAIYEGRIVQLVKVATGQVYIPYMRRALLVPPGDLYLYGSFTSPAFRGCDLAPARAVRMMHHYRSLGYRRMVCVIAVENRSGYGVVEKLGYCSLGMYNCLRLGPWQYDWQRTYGGESLPKPAGRR